MDMVCTRVRRYPNKQCESRSSLPRSSSFQAVDSNVNIGLPEYIPYFLLVDNYGIVLAVVSKCIALYRRIAL